MFLIVNAAMIMSSASMWIAGIPKMQDLTCQLYMPKGFLVKQYRPNGVLKVHNAR